MSDRIENTGGTAVKYNNVKKAGDREARKLKVGVWAGVMPKETADNMPKLHPIITLKPWKINCYAPAGDLFFNFLPKLGMREIQFNFIEKPRSVDLFKETLVNFEKTIGASPEIIMGYMQWYDGWEYQSFPEKFCDLCYENGKMPIITWQPSFKRKYANASGTMTFLDEFNTEVKDRKSELYRYIVAFAKDAKNWTETHRDPKTGKPATLYIRPFHEMNLGFAYDWTGYMNGGKDGPAKLKMAWKNIYDIFKLQVKADNVNLIWCPEAHPDTENTPELGEAWNSIENYYPGDRYVDNIGFDVYQKKAGTDFNELFKDASGFIAKHPGIPAGICEASTYPEPYRVKFIEDLFSVAEKMGLEYVVWFNENKQGTGEGEENWNINARLTQPTEEENKEEVSDIIKRMLDRARNKQAGNNKETPKIEPDVKKGQKESLTPSEGLIALRKAIGAPKLSSKYVLADDPALFRKELKLPEDSRPQSYNKAMEELRKKKLGRTQKRKIQAYPFLDMLYAIGDKFAARLKLAKVHIAKWQSAPVKYSTDPDRQTDFQVALDILDENIAGPDEVSSDRFYTPENLLSKMEKIRALMKYNEIFLDETDDAEIKYPVIKEAETVCKNIQMLLKAESGYIKEVNRREQRFNKEEVLGMEASVLVFRGDIYMSEGNRNIDKAKKFYRDALTKIEEKDDWSGIKERYLNRSAKMGLCRAHGLSATTREQLDGAVAELTVIINDKQKYDPGLKIKAKLYLGELLKHYYDLYNPDIKTSEVSKDEAAEKISQAYAVYRELKNTELVYVAAKRMDELKRIDASLRSGTKITTF